MFDWFMTVPGILVLCGIVLLIIAVILFMLGNKKDKKAAAINATPSVDTNPNLNNEVITNNEVNVVSAQPVEEVSVAPTTEEVPGVIDFTPETNNVEGNLDLSLNSETQDLDLSIGTNEPDLDLSIGNAAAPATEAVEETKTSVEDAPMVSIGGVDLLSSVGVMPTMDNTASEPEIKVIEPTNDVAQPASVDMPSIAIPDVLPTTEPVAPAVEEVKPIEPEITIETPVMDAPVIPEPVVETPVAEPVIETPIAPVDDQPLDLGISPAPLEQQVIEPQPATIDLQPAQVQVEEINIENN